MLRVTQLKDTTIGKKEKEINKTSGCEALTLIRRTGEKKIPRNASATDTSEALQQNRIKKNYKINK